MEVDRPEKILVVSKMYAWVHLRTDADNYEPLYNENYIYKCRIIL